ncbi:uncharacterized protein cyth3a isoform X5 [Callorhinchus milii]|uniref:uncharacterized protein cyth3a isoform X5 n=1 Tax=Callorhinchus milii TaxID=7868 RepID=UPI0004572F9E|nr:uncharacterized protein cyth3a isoform X5 [Callorhinchus milii]|eukprot:gi/632987832/ref/XP_007882774.1/ PREDICTED: protein FAM220A isoform X2 [Callorhinchus milii]
MSQPGNMLSMKSLRNTCISSLVLEEGGECSSPTEGTDQDNAPRDPNGNTRCTRRSDGGIYNQLHGVTFPLRLQSGVATRDVPLPHIGGSEPPSLSEQVRPVVCPFTESVVPLMTHNSADAAGQKGLLDENFVYGDSAVLSDWLRRGSRALKDLKEWCNAGENFVRFAYFWLSEIPHNQKMKLLHLERGILKDQLCFAFARGLCAGKIQLRDLDAILSFTFWEYPQTILESNRLSVFLDHLDLMSSERTVELNGLLSDVKYSTRSPHAAQWTRAIRAFVLATLWLAVVKFYRSFVSNSQPPRSLDPQVVSEASTCGKQKMEVLRHRSSTLPCQCNPGTVDGATETKAR